MDPEKELGPDAFHSESVSPLMNQAPVPLCRNPRAMLKFFYGSGGQSQPKYILLQLVTCQTSMIILGSKGDVGE
jgi:hypothetical protein